MSYLLRVLFVSGSIFAIGFYFQQEPPLWSAIGWTVLYVGIHGYWIWRILRERRPVVLNPDEKALFQLRFNSLDERKFALLVGLGVWRDGQPGEKVFAEGDAVSDIIVPITGKISARSNGKIIGYLGPGQLVGTAAVLINGVAPCDAFFDEPTRYIAWSVPTVQDFLARDVELRGQMRDIVNRDLARIIHDASRI